jgi:hypothetical protein
MLLFTILCSEILHSMQIIWLKHW